jgi:phosphoribosyl-AMP cyclohydrolase / phosphoribosyl-ATP pyrophosphohydrolase
MTTPTFTQKLAQGLDLEALRFDERGLLPVVAQDQAKGTVLMLAWANRAAIEQTLMTGEAYFFSRSRGELWHKGATSGNVLEVVEVLVDCDADTLLYRVRPRGPACHRGTGSCFEPNPAALELGWLFTHLQERQAADPETSYTARLLARGRPRIAQKVGEEAVETVIAALSGSDDELIGESADLLYHLLVLLLERGIAPARLAEKLLARHLPGEKR